MLTHHRNTRWIIPILGVLMLPIALSGASKRDDALESAFEGAEIRRQTVALNDDELRRASELAGLKIEQQVYYPYEAWRNDEKIGTVYFDRHRVRTLPETVMFAISTDGHITAVEVVAFHEPQEYLPAQRWYNQFQKRKLDEDLNLYRGIHGISGATLTSRATASAARRVLSVHKVLGQRVP